jgi:hypothetical protein
MFEGKGGKKKVGNDEVVSVEEKKEAKGVKQLKEQKK